MLDVKYIDTTDLDSQLPTDWPAKSLQALEHARKATPNERNKAVDSKAGVWRELKPLLASISTDKCWYCESKDIRSDNTVDHYRPKGSVAKVNDHPGYWWLAFDHRNFRFSCTYCNSRRKDRTTGTSGGKHDQFPLLDEARRAYSEQDDIGVEQPVLLDPTSALDPTLLWFEPDGRAVPRYDDGQSPAFHCRAYASIQLLNLNEVMLLNRRKDIHRTLHDALKATDVQINAAFSSNETAEEAVTTAFRAIRRAIHPSTAHSSAARAMLSPYVVDYPWLEAVLTT